MIYRKGNMWKVVGSAAKYATREQAMKAAGWCLTCEKSLCECGVEDAGIEEGYNNGQDNRDWYDWFSKNSNPKIP